MSTETNSRVTNASAWKKSSVQGGELEVPSGNVCLVRKPDGMRVFMSKGMIPNSLMPIVQTAIAEGGKGNAKPVDPSKLMAEVLEDPKKLQDMMSLIDAVVCDIVLEPKVCPVPAEGEERDDEVLYVDEVDMDDRMFLFQFAVGGTKDLERFRGEQASTMASISDGGEVRDEAE